MWQLKTAWLKGEYVTHEGNLGKDPLSPGKQLLAKGQKPIVCECAIVSAHFPCSFCRLSINLPDSAGLSQHHSWELPGSIFHVHYSQSCQRGSRLSWEWGCNWFKKIPRWRIYLEKQKWSYLASSVAYLEILPLVLCKACVAMQFPALEGPGIYLKVQGHLAPNTVSTSWAHRL